MSGRDSEGERERTTEEVSLLKAMSKPRIGLVLGMSLAAGPKVGQMASGIKVARAESAGLAWNVGKRTRALRQDTPC